MSPTPLLIAMLALAAPAAEDPFSRGEVRELFLTGGPGTMVEHFRIDLPSEAPGPASVPLGLARWIRGPLPGEEGGWRTACEVLLREERTRVLHTERLAPRLRELVFRELRERSGRTVYLSWTPDGAAVSTQTVGGDVQRREFDLRAGGLPLSLVELARRGASWEGELDVFRPLSNDLERWSATLAPLANGRELRLVCADGLEAGAFAFEGERLASFRWQAGGPVARAIPADEYERWEHGMTFDAPGID